MLCYITNVNNGKKFILELRLFLSNKLLQDLSIWFQLIFTFQLLTETILSKGVFLESSNEKRNSYKSGTLSKINVFLHKRRLNVLFFDWLRLSNLWCTHWRTRLLYYKKNRLCYFETFFSFLVSHSHNGNVQRSKAGKSFIPIKNFSTDKDNWKPLQKIHKGRIFL